VSTTRVLVADDHPIVRQGLRQVLELEGDIEVVGEATDGMKAIQLCDSLDPDVVLMDVNMPGLNGIEAARRIARRMPEIGILVLTIHDEEEYMLEAVKAGVIGYVLKDVEPKELVKAVRAVAGGRYYVHPDMGGKLLRELAVRVGGKVPNATGRLRRVGRDADAAATAASGRMPSLGAGGEGEEPDRRFEELTPREREVLKLVSQGASNREIASALYISEKTVKNHVTHILKKIGVDDRLQAALLAVREGWVESM